MPARRPTPYPAIRRCVHAVGGTTTRPSLGDAYPAPPKLVVPPGWYKAEDNLNELIGFVLGRECDIHEWQQLVPFFVAFADGVHVTADHVHKVPLLYYTPSAHRANAKTSSEGTYWFQYNSSSAVGVTMAARDFLGTLYATRAQAVLRAACDYGALSLEELERLAESETVVPWAVEYALALRTSVPAAMLPVLEERLCSSWPPAIERKNASKGQLAFDASSTPDDDERWMPLEHKRVLCALTTRLRMMGQHTTVTRAWLYVPSTEEFALYSATHKPPVRNHYAYVTGFMPLGGHRETSLFATPVQDGGDLAFALVDVRNRLESGHVMLVRTIAPATCETGYELPRCIQYPRAIPFLALHIESRAAPVDDPDRATSTQGGGLFKLSPSDVLERMEARRCTDERYMCLGLHTLLEQLEKLRKRLFSSCAWCDDWGLENLDTMVQHRPRSLLEGRKIMKRFPVPNRHPVGSVRGYVLVTLRGGAERMDTDLVIKEVQEAGEEPRHILASLSALSMPRRVVYREFHDAADSQQVEFNAPCLALLVVAVPPPAQKDVKVWTVAVPSISPLSVIIGARYWADVRDRR